MTQVTQVTRLTWVRTRFIAAAAAALVTVAACGTSGHHAAPTTGPTLPRPTSTHTLTAGPSIPLDVPNVPADRHNVTIGSCAGDSNSWHAAGTATNSTGVPATYEVTVFFTTEHATVLGFASTKVLTAAHKQATWSVASKFVNSGSLRCVLRGVAVLR